MTAENKVTMTRSQVVASDVAALLRARNPLIWVTTREEARVEGYLAEAAASARLRVRTWDVARGFAEGDGSPFAGDVCQDPGDALRLIAARAQDGADRCLWVMRDLPAWLTGPGGATTLRQLRNLVRELPRAPLERAQAVVILAASGEVPPELAANVIAVDWPLPDRAEVAGILDAVVASGGVKIEPLNGNRDAAVDAAVGLSGDEARACYGKCLVQLRKVDPATVAAEKKRVIARERVLEYHDPLPGGFDMVGGLDLLKGWLATRAAAYTPEARAYGLPAPRGAMLVGVPGCGKSLMAKVIATAWRVPLVRLDMGALRSKFVGESEGNLRRALRVIEAIGRCVVWVDEIEKAMSGSTGPAGDGGVAADALGTILNWMQERQGEAFVLATANDVTGLPPELMRKGRFDEIWFVDLPNSEERAAVVEAALRARGRGHLELDTVYVATRCDGFTGAEIAALVPDALYAAFADGKREITADDLARAAKTVVPLAVTAKEKISALREWARGRARPASSPGRAGPSVSRETAARSWYYPSIEGE